MPHTAPTDPLDAAVFIASGLGAATQLPPVLDRLDPRSDRIIVVSDDLGFPGLARVDLRLSSLEMGLEGGTPEVEAVANALLSWSGVTPETTGPGPTFVIDMRWLSLLERGGDALAAWGAAIERGLASAPMRVLSVYHADSLVDAQPAAAMRAHQFILAPSGLYANPFWIPSGLRHAPRGEQVSFLLGRIVPDHAEVPVFDSDDSFAARGAAPAWLPRPRDVTAVEEAREGWRIHCLGQLRVNRADGARIDWKIKGGAPKKTRTLFAYLLTCGDKGAHADQCAELLWPDCDDPETARARLHHTVAMLRRTLGGKDSLLRSGDYYRLTPPDGTWIDITRFEQLCRRGMSLYQRAKGDDALVVYTEAERLYSGDLFQDLPNRYVDTEQEDWCLARRQWLREMAIKLQSHMSMLLRQKGRLRAALDHAHKALALDPASESGHCEVLHVLHAQGRMDALARHYRQYLSALAALDASPEGSEVQALYRALASR